jgi:hypothetical protein
MKKTFLSALILLLILSLIGCTSERNESQPKEEQNKAMPQQTVENEETNSIVYKNSQYGFDFSLPESWNGYAIVAESWEGTITGDTQSEVTALNGPMISIRHPKWTAENPRQDIPIMIFTITQWNSLQQGKFHIGAAPIGPSELGRNAKYVFALPARYNYAFPTGYEEVESILKTNSLQPIENK